MRIEPFTMERWQSLHEHQVEFNLSDSGVHPLTVEELLEDTDPSIVLRQALGYTQTNGTEALRNAIAGLYRGTTANHILATTGGIEANFLATWHVLEPGDEAVVMLPNYMQVWGLARSLGARCKAWRLRPDFASAEWVADLDELSSLVTPNTKLIAICHPNNPTGQTWGDAWLDEVVRIAERCGAWVLSDEIYHGAELTGQRTPTMWGRYENTLVTNSLSKAYGLPGLRLGWVLAAPETTAALWGRHDYTTIAPSALSDTLGRIALEPQRRQRLLARTRRLLGANCQLVCDWLDRHGPLYEYIRPQAGAMLTLRYAHDIDSLVLAERLRQEQGVLVVPGDQFEMPGWLRIGFGGEARNIEAGLARMHAILSA